MSRLSQQTLLAENLCQVIRIDIQVASEFDTDEKAATAHLGDKRLVQFEQFRL